MKICYHQLTNQNVNKTRLFPCRYYIPIGLLCVIIVLLIHFNDSGSEKSQAETIVENFFRDRYENTQLRKGYHDVGNCKRGPSKNAHHRYHYHHHRPSHLDKSEPKPEVRLALAICGSRLEQGMVMIKSAILFSKEVKLFVDIFQDNSTAPYLLYKLKELQKGATALNVSFEFRIHDAQFPSGHDKKWRTFYAPCSSQRLFFPSLLPDLDSVIYLDTDIIFLSSVRELWSHFNYMDDRQVAGMAFDDEPGVQGYYATYGKTPYYGNGLNAGLMLMNLTKMRTIDFQNEMLLIMDAFDHDKLLTGDQDLVNIYFHYHPCLVYELSCAFNYGFEHCTCPYGREVDCSCHDANVEGVALLHGRGGTFERTFYETQFVTEILNAIKNFNLESGDLKKIMRNLSQKLTLGSATSCFKLDTDHKMLRRMRKYVDLHF